MKISRKFLAESQRRRNKAARYLTFEKRWYFLLTAAVVVVSKQVDVERTTVDSGRNDRGRRQRRIMTNRRKTVRGSETGKKWRWASSVECSRRLRESVDDSNMVKDGSAGKRVPGGEPEKSAKGEVADAGICMGLGSEGRADGWGYNKTKHDECPDVQAASRKNANEDRWLVVFLSSRYRAVARAELSR